MNNKDKEEYLSYLIIHKSGFYPAEHNWAKTLANKTPKRLFKFRNFDKYTFEMIRDNYAYLSPIGGLDDPFDCLTSYGIKTPKSSDQNVAILKRIFELINIKQDREEIMNLSLSSLDSNGKLNLDEFKEKLNEIGAFDSKREIEDYFAKIEKIFVRIKAALESDRMKGFVAVAMNPTYKVGVCALTSKRDNKVMWSLYSREYKGYCIEYEIPNIDEVKYKLFPVIYRRKIDNNITNKVLQHIFGRVERELTQGKSRGQLGATNEIYILKDIDWSYQDEWRLLGDAKTHFKGLKIKAIYLGFKVTKRNEIRMTKASEKYGFELFKMKTPSGSKTIKYSKIAP